MNLHLNECATSRQRSPQLLTRPIGSVPGTGAPRSQAKRSGNGRSASIGRRPRSEAALRPGFASAAWSAFFMTPRPRVLQVSPGGLARSTHWSRLPSGPRLRPCRAGRPSRASRRHASARADCSHRVATTRRLSPSHRVIFFPFAPMRRADALRIPLMLEIPS